MVVSPAALIARKAVETSPSKSLREVDGLIIIKFCSSGTGLRLTLSSIDLNLRRMTGVVNSKISDAPNWFGEILTAVWWEEADNDGTIRRGALAIPFLVR